MKRLVLRFATIVVAVSCATTALAAHIPGFTVGGEQFTINPAAVGEGGALTAARFLDFSYSAEVDQPAGAPPAGFTETGAGFFGTLRNSLGGPPIGGSGLNDNYSLSFLFSATGVVSPGPGFVGLDGLFSSFALEVFVDKDRDTTFTTVTPGGADESRTVTGGSADDVLVLTGALLFRPECVTPTNPAGACGGFHVFGGLANGDFAVELKVERVGDFFGGDAFETGHTFGDVNGVNSSILGIPPAPFGGFVDAVIPGSGNASFAVPTPDGLLLIGTALMALGFVSRRRTRR